MTVAWFSAFLFVLAVGCLAFCLPLPIAVVGRGFYRTMAGWSLALGGFAALTRPLDGGAACVTSFVFLGTAFFVNGLLWAKADRAASALSIPAVLAGLVGVWAMVRRDPALPPAEPWIVGASLAASVAMLGTVLDSMVLGHLYLNKAGMSFTYLSRMNGLFAASVVLRALVLGAEAVFLSQIFRAATTDQLLFFMRLAVGVIGPGVLAWMTWRCIRLKSNQSATGILYVACIFVLIGEMVSTWHLRGF